MEKGTELSAKLLKIDMNPVVRDVLIQQQQDIFFLRKEQIQAAQVIAQLSDIVMNLSSANYNIIKDIQELAHKGKAALENDVKND